MGCRFPLNSLNIVANLSFKKVMSCYHAITTDYENQWMFRDFLENFDENFYSDDRDHHHIIEELKRLVHNINVRSSFDYDNDLSREYKKELHHDKQLIEYLRYLSDVLSRCRIKSLLLPKPYGETRINDEYMIKKRTLQSLLKWHPSDSCLILQPIVRPERDGIFVFDSFPNFDVALRQIEQWPAVMFWDMYGGFLFIPIDHEEELQELYKIAHYEEGYLHGALRYHAEKKAKKPSHYYFHLSDLHFGSCDVPVAERRLRRLIQNKVSTFNSYDRIGFIITGDAVDSPEHSNKIDFMNFSDNIASISQSRPITVLGNHDIDDHGLSILSNRRSFVDFLGHFPNIRIDEEAKTIFLLFNSNVSGSLAKGNIGTTQLSEMGNILDNVENLNSYKLVAVLHHHVMPIPEPDWRTQEWYKKLLPKGFLEETLKLQDADTFLEWLKLRNVRTVIHGHKHVPFINEKDGIKIIACGSSTGQVKHVDKDKTYMSYNLLKINDSDITCIQYVEEICGAGAIDIKI